MCESCFFGYTAINTDTDIQYMAQPRVQYITESNQHSDDINL